jgi:hypothetical protein
MRSSLGKVMKTMDWRYNTIWFDQIDPAKVAIFDCKLNTPQVLEGLGYVTLWHYKQSNLMVDQLPESNSVEYLEMNLGGTRSLEGIGRLPALRRLEMHHCTKLESDNGIAEIGSTLKILHISTCKKFTLPGDVSSLRDLEILRLNACGEIEDLEFLHELPRLIDFRFVGTKIRSGDLSPILAHQNLKSVGFDDKRHYNLKTRQIVAALAEKYPGPFKDFVHKDEWTTFKYSDFHPS